MDGVWSVKEFGGSTVTGETMPDGTFYGFDIVNHDSQDLRFSGWNDRRAALIDCAARNGFQVSESGTGAAFIKAVLANGGEGVVAKPVNSKFGVGWIKVKRVETFDVTITAKLTNAVAVELDGVPSGKCPLKGAEFDAAEIGDIIEIAAFSRLDSGKFREPRFIRFRHDKKIERDETLSGESIGFTISL